MPLLSNYTNIDKHVLHQAHNQCNDGDFSIYNNITLTQLKECMKTHWIMHLLPNAVGNLVWLVRRFESLSSPARPRFTQ